MDWSQRGYSVTVLTGQPNYPSGKIYPGYRWFSSKHECLGDIEIIRIPIIPRGKSYIQLGLNYVSFVFSGYFWALFTKRRFDFVFTFGVSPILQAIPAIRYSKRFKLPSYLYVQDLWPESVESILKIKKKWILGPLDLVVKYIYNNSNKIFTTSKGFIDAINQKGIDREKLIYWPQYSEPPSSSASNQKDPQIDPCAFSITFTGNVGNAQGLEVLIDCARILKDQQKITRPIIFYIVGDGRYKSKLISECRLHGLNDMFIFFNRRPVDEIPGILNASNVAFLPLASKSLFEMTIPAKLQTYLQSGLPILACAGGEVRKIIEESEAGVCVPQGDAKKLAEAVLYLYDLPAVDLIEIGKNASRYNEIHFSRDILLRKMDEYFAS